MMGYKISFYGEILLHTWSIALYVKVLKNHLKIWSALKGKNLFPS